MLRQEIIMRRLHYMLQPYCHAKKITQIFSFRPRKHASTNEIGGCVLVGYKPTCVWKF